ncbi:hypothetical protein E1890_21410 [Salmonella enterica subsp. enterica serovar Mountpleasant]|nr:hypothetical protein [Salmonella enterica subsp. enterica serovar Mountpleasant]
MNIYFCQFLFFSLCIIKYCFWPRFFFMNQSSGGGRYKGIYWCNRTQNLKDLFILCYHGTILT